MHSRLQARPDKTPHLCVCCFRMSSQPFLLRQDPQSNDFQLQSSRTILQPVVQHSNVGRGDRDILPPALARSSRVPSLSRWRCDECVLRSPQPPYVTAQTTPRLALSLLLLLLMLALAAALVATKGCQRQRCTARRWKGRSDTVKDVSPRLSGRICVAPG